MSDDWLSDFENFLKDMYSTYETGLTIERLDVNGDYCKENCCWITRAAQTLNKRSNVFVNTLKGRMTVIEAANLANISWTAMMYRIKRKWPMEKLLIPATAKGR